MLVTVPCSGCSRLIQVEKTWVQAAHAEGREYITFCSRRCNLRHVAIHGAIEQRRVLQEEISNVSGRDRPDPR
jgi:predicted Fe-S protein YdhL (DUF1289 family)